jgi:hypothetical protein
MPYGQPLPPAAPYQAPYQQQRGRGQAYAARIQAMQQQAQQAQAFAQQASAAFQPATTDDSGDPGMTGTADSTSTDPSTGASTDPSSTDAMNGEIGCEGDIDHPGFAGDHYTTFKVDYHRTGLEDPFGILGETYNFGSEDDGYYVEPWMHSEPIMVDYHMSRVDAFGPTHTPYSFGLEGSEMTDTEGMPEGPVGSGPGSFGFDDEFYDGFGPAMIFGDEAGCDIKG